MAMFFNDMYPFVEFELFDEPTFAYPTQHHRSRKHRKQIAPHPGSSNSLRSSSIRPAMDVAEDADGYRMEAELPGVKREEIKVRVGDGGRSVTVEGRVDRQEAQVQKQDDQEQQICSERSFVNQATFHRTFWLPRPVDSANVKAKMEDGILTVSIPKAKEDKTTVDVEVN